MPVRQVRGHANWKRFSAAFSEALKDCGEQLTAFGRRIMNESCREWLDATDAEWPSGTMTMPNGAKFGGDREHPWYTGQLHDSVAVMITERNRIVALEFMHPSANKPQTAFGKDVGGNFTNIIGADWAREEARKAQYVFLPGLQARLIVGVPYARKVNEQARHAGYLENLNALFASYVEDRMEVAMEDGKYRTRVFKPRK